jgi:hypothetical protein
VCNELVLVQPAKSNIATAKQQRIAVALAPGVRPLARRAVTSP